MGPGGCLVVEGAGLQASVQDTDKPVGQTAECVVMFYSLGALLIVEGPGAGRGVQGREGLGVQPSTSRSLWMKRAATTFFFPDARVIGLVAA